MTGIYTAAAGGRIADAGSVFYHSNGNSNFVEAIADTPEGCAGDPPVSPFRTSVAFTTPNQNGSGAIRIDGDGKVWIAFTSGAQTGSTRVGVYDPSSGAYTAFVPYTSTASDMAIDRSGNVWLANASSGGLMEIVGAAAPQLTPLSLTNTGGRRP